MSPSLSRCGTLEAGAVGRLHALGPLEVDEVIERREIERREAISKPIFENAFGALVDEQYLRRNGDRLELTESLRTPKAASALEGRIAAFGWGAPR